MINALGQGHWDQTLRGPLEAAKAYSNQKKRHAQTEARCAQAGIVFEPIVFEIQGGVEPRAAALLHRIAESVAAAEGLDVAKTKSEFLQRLGVIIAPVQRRGEQKQISTAARGLKRALGEIAGLAVPPDQN